MILDGPYLAVVPAEQYVLEQLQEHTKIRDRNALAAIMGNIKQESNFHSNICEGGARISYDACRSGGYGLIQWTSINRYNNLGKFCEKYGCDPSSLEGQTRYMINESTFQRVLPEFEGRGQTVSQYMVPSFYWLGWGIKGRPTIILLVGLGYQGQTWIDEEVCLTKWTICGVQKTR